MNDFSPAVVLYVIHMWWWTTKWFNCFSLMQTFLSLSAVAYSFFFASVSANSFAINSIFSPVQFSRNVYTFFELFVLASGWFNVNIEQIWNEWMRLMNKWYWMNETAVWACMLMFAVNKVRYPSCASNDSNFRALNKWKMLKSAKSHNVYTKRPSNVGIIMRDILLIKCIWWKCI